MKPVPTRIGVAEDVDEIVRVTNAAYQIEKFFISVDRTDPATVRRLMDKGVFIVTDGAPGRLEGTVYVELRGSRAYFGMLAADPETRGKGIGRALVDAAEQHARDAGCEAMDIRVVNLRTELPAFYLKLGYVEVGPEFEPIPHVTQPCHYVRWTKTL